MLSTDGDFTEPTETRSLDDIKYKGNYINIKFGYKKEGQPNICSMKRLFTHIHNDKIDSYYIMSVDAYGPKFQLFDVFDYIDFTNFNYGTGQLMLCEKKVKEVYKFDYVNDLYLTKIEKIVKMGQMMKVECDRHIEQKKNQQQQIDEIVNGYKSSNLFELCRS